MMLKRFVTYIYQYERGNRGPNVGFVKTDIRDAGCRMEIQLRGLDRFQGKAKVYLIIPEETAIGVCAGEIPIHQGAGRLKLAYARNILGASGFSVNQIQAVIIRYGNDRLLASCWSEQVPGELLWGKFDVWGEPNENPQEQDAADADHATPMPMPEPVSEHAAPVPATEQTVNPATSAPTPEQNTSPAAPAPTPAPDEPVTDGPIAMNTGSQAASPDSAAAQAVPEAPQEPLPPQITYRKIAIADIRGLPKRNWYLCNNSFLIHGFFNYHYLILKTVTCDGQQKSYLGVPGIYEQPERMMAMVFGFPTFEPIWVSESASDTEAAPADLPPDSYDVGVFGYWMLPLMS